MTRTIIFDLDGTLVDTAPDLAAAMNAVLTAHGRTTLPPDSVRMMVGHGARSLMKTAFARTGPAADEHQLDRLYDEYLAHYTGHIAAASQPFPGARAALDTLMAQDAKLGICTNKPEAPTHQLLAALELDRYFTGILGGDSLAVRKPDAAHVLETIARAGGAADGAVMIGDSRNDIEAARNAGIPVIAVSFGYSDPPVAELGPDLVIDHFDELTGAIDRLG